jgi:hypothetical protein
MRRNERVSETVPIALLWAAVLDSENGAEPLAPFFFFPSRVDAVVRIPFQRRVWLPLN